mgnify:CR=1 FL=1
MASGREEREVLFQLSKSRLEAFGHKIIADGSGNNDYVVMCIAVDVNDSMWVGLAKIFMPDRDLDQYSNQETKFIIIGIASASICKYIGARVPSIVEALDAQLPEGYVKAIILGFGGAVIYPLEIIPQGTTEMQNRPRLPYSNN